MDRAEWLGYTQSVTLIAAVCLPRGCSPIEPSVLGVLLIFSAAACCLHSTDLSSFKQLEWQFPTKTDRGRESPRDQWRHSETQAYYLYVKFSDGSESQVVVFFFFKYCRYYVIHADCVGEKWTRSELSLFKQFLERLCRHCCAFLQFFVHAFECILLFTARFKCSWAFHVL